MSGKTVVITGISGHFGRALWPLLAADPDIERVVGLDCEPPGYDTSGGKLEFHRCDVRGEPTWASRLEGADALVHLAFLLMRLPSHRDVDAVNVAGTRAVCEAAVRQGVRKLIIASSVVAYGIHPDNPVPLTEEAPLRPNPGLYYGRAKAANEQFLDGLQRQHPGLVITRLRPCTVVGPSVAPARVASLLGDPAFTVRGANPPIQLLHEADVASALHLALSRDLPGAYNVTSDEPVPLDELVRLRGGRIVALPLPLVKGLMALTWWLRLSEFAPEWVDLSRYPLVASNQKLKAAGWAPRYTTAQAFRDLAACHGAARR